MWGALKKYKFPDPAPPPTHTPGWLEGFLGVSDPQPGLRSTPAEVAGEKP